MFGVEKFVTVAWMAEEFQSNNHHSEQAKMAKN
jgi:hypothetical protein